MDQLICASLSHTDYYWYEVVIDYSMLKVHTCELYVISITNSLSSIYPFELTVCGNKASVLVINAHPSQRACCKFEVLDI